MAGNLVVQIQDPLVTDLRPEAGDRWYYATKAGLTLEVYDIQHGVSDGRKETSVKCRVVNPNDPPVSSGKRKKIQVHKARAPVVKPTTAARKVSQTPYVPKVAKTSVPKVAPVAKRTREAPKASNTSAVPKITIPQSVSSKESGGVNTATLIVIIGVSVLALVMVIVMIICCCKTSDNSVSRLGPHDVPVFVVPSPERPTRSRTSRSRGSRSSSRRCEGLPALTGGGPRMTDPRLSRGSRSSNRSLTPSAPSH